MKIFNADQQKNIRINNILQRIKDEANKQKTKTFIYFPIFSIYGRNFKHEESISTRALFKELEKMGAIKIDRRTRREMNETLKESKKLKNPITIEGYPVKLIEPKFSQLCKEFEEKVNKKHKEKTKDILSIPDRYKVSVVDREIRINNYLIARPHAVGNNLDFFEYIRSQPKNTEIKRKKLPDKFGNESLKNLVQKKRFVNILFALGFKGEIKRAFFHKVGQSSLFYRGDEITKEDLQKNKIKIEVFLKELELANAKKSSI